MTTMNRQEIFRKVLDILRSTDDTVDCQAIRLDDEPFRYYGIDSLTMIRLGARIDEKFGITIKEGDASAAYSFDRLVDLIERMLRAPGRDAASPNLAGGELAVEATFRLRPDA